MKPSDFLNEESAIARAIKGFKQARKQNRATAQQAKNLNLEYKNAMDKFQKELNVSDPARANELKTLRDEYNQNPTFNAAARLSLFIQDHAAYVADQNLAANAVAAAGSVAQQLRGQTQAQPMRPGQYAVPKAAPAGAPPATVDINGLIFKFDQSTQKWLDPKNIPVSDPDDINKLNQTWYEQSGKPYGGGASPEEIRKTAQAQTAAKAEKEMAANATSAASTMPAVFRSGRRAAKSAAPAKPKYKPNPAGGAPIRVAENKDFSSILWSKMTSKRSPSRWQLLEGKEGKNLHLEHLEDLVFNEGYLGAKRALNYCENLRRMLDEGEGDKTKITVKWDGCIHEDSVILTDKGDVTIKDIVNSPNDWPNMKIVGYDFEDKLKTNTTLFSGQVTDGSKEWVELTLEDGTSLKLTADHEVHTVNRGWIRAGDIDEGDELTEL